jgi:imidazole glycerol phosphate synthase glutamine amidotransferase subunit
VRVLVVSTGAANLASVLAGLRRAGAEPGLVSGPEDLLHAERLVLPGVGAFGAAATSLQAAGLWSALHERLTAGRPTLGICLGLQLWAEGSEESPGVAGLGALPGLAKRLPVGVRVPQLGWNWVEPGRNCHLLQPGYASYANSYALRAAPEGWAAAWTIHGEPFIAAVERGPQLACQFHPELSGPWGQALLTRWLGAR